jgi:hypothetical protein
MHVANHGTSAAADFEVVTTAQLALEPAKG